jgi:hypothetical protein
MTKNECKRLRRGTTKTFHSYRILMVRKPSKLQMLTLPDRINQKILNEVQQQKATVRLNSLTCQLDKEECMGIAKRMEK